MTSIVRPTPRQRTRRLLVLVAAVFAIMVPIAQNLADWGLSQAEFAADGDSTLRVAGYAFSIWGLIYLGILAYAVRLVLPQTGESALISHMAFPSIVAFFGIGMWIIVAALNLKVASVGVIFAAKFALLIPLLLAARAIRNLPMRDGDRLFLAWPLAALAGWLTIAAPLNLLTTATALNALPTMLSPSGWAILAIVVVVLVALAMTWALRLMAFPLPIAWGLIGAFVAEQERNPTVGFTALAAAVLLIIGSVVLVFRLQRGVEKAR